MKNNYGKSYNDGATESYPVYFWASAPLTP
jgi:hypothetical protein